MDDVEIARAEGERLAEKVRVPGSAEARHVMKRRYRAALLDWYTLLAETPYYCDMVKEARMTAGIDMLRLVIKDLGGSAPKPWGRDHLHKILYVPNNPEILREPRTIGIAERWQYKHRRRAHIYRMARREDFWRIRISDQDAGGSLSHGGEVLYGHDTRDENQAVNIGVAWVLRGERP